MVRLIEVDDDHALHSFTSDGRLVETVRELAAVAAGEDHQARQPSRFERFVAPFFEEPTLWPVLLVLAAHAFLFGAVLLAFGVRDRNPFALGAIALLIVGTLDIGFRLAKARTMGRFGWALVAFWLGSGLGAVVASRFHVF
jgi:hypothetical protein